MSPGSADHEFTITFVSTWIKRNITLLHVLKLIFIRYNLIFVDAIKNINAGQMALLAVKGINQFPDTSEKLTGTVDIWWIVHDGGMLMLLPFLLKQHKTFKNCRLRIFTVARILWQTKMLCCIHFFSVLVKDIWWSSCLFVCSSIIFNFWVIFEVLLGQTFVNFNPILWTRKYWSR